jgi:hypothetical protein
MSYILNTSNGSILTTLADGILDSTTTSIGLIGRNYTGFGETINENFIKVLENFANSSAPSAPLPGQIWWDTGESRLKVYDGTTKSWRTSGGPILSPTSPIMVAGDTWIDTANRQLYFSDGVGTPTLVGPSYSSSQGISGFVIEDILDNGGATKSVASMYVGNIRIAILSKEQFTPLNAVIGLTTAAIVPGMNLLNTTGEINPVISGTATNAKGIDGVGTANLLRSDSNDTTIGTIRIKNDGGIGIGNAQEYFNLLVNSQRDTVFKNNNSNRKMLFTLRGGSATDEVALDINPGNRQVSFYPTVGNADVRVNGDLTVEQNLVVNGSTTTVNTATLTVEDKNIELAAAETPTDAIASGGGITLKGTTDHTITWQVDLINGNYWTVSDHLNLANTKEYKINNQSILSSTRLFNTVVESNIEQLGDLVDLTIQNGPSIVGNTLTTSDSLTFSIDGDLNLTNGVGDVEIKGVSTPSASNSAANKAYVDVKTRDTIASLSFDMTNYNTDSKYDQSITATWLEQVASASDRNVGTLAKVHCVFYLSGGYEREVRVYNVESTLGVRVWEFQGVESVSQP